MSDSNYKEVPAYLIQIQKQTAMTGEVLTISGNLPRGTTEEELKAEVAKIGAAIDRRVEVMNDEIKKATNGRYSATDYDIAAATGIPVDELRKQ